MYMLVITFLLQAVLLTIYVSAWIMPISEFELFYYVTVVQVFVGKAIIHSYQFIVFTYVLAVNSLPYSSALRMTALENPVLIILPLAELLCIGSIYLAVKHYKDKTITPFNYTLIISMFALSLVGIKIGAMEFYGNECALGLDAFYNPRNTLCAAMRNVAHYCVLIVIPGLLFTVLFTTVSYFINKYPAGIRPKIQ